MNVKIEKIYDIDGQMLPVRISGKTYPLYPMETEFLISELGMSHREFLEKVRTEPFELQKKIIKIMINEIPEEVLEKATKSEILIWGKMCLSKLKKDIRSNVYQAV